MGERYGFRIESGRSGPRGNKRLRRNVGAIGRNPRRRDPLDAILITGDLTDAGRSAEWAEFFAALAPHPQLAELVVALPGNHDVNVVDRANPARLDLPTSPKKRLRQIRTISALGVLQGSRPPCRGYEAGRLGGTLADALKPHVSDIAAFADTGIEAPVETVAELWAASFRWCCHPIRTTGWGSSC